MSVLGGESAEHALEVARGESLQKGDPVGEVSVDGADGGTSAFGDHGRGEPLEADLVDHGCRGIQQRGEAGGASRLHRRVAQGHE